MNSDRLILFFLTDLIFCLTPGPATMVTVGHVLGGGLRAGIGPVAGIHAGNAVWYGLNALGLIALIAAAPHAYAVLRWVGIAYLLAMGARTWWRAGQRLQPSVASADTAVSAAPGLRFWNGAADGLAVQMSNPKALVFYAAFVPQFVDPAGSIALQILLLALVTLVTESIGMGTYATLAAGANRFAVGRDWNRWLQRISGAIMVFVGVVMIWANSHSLPGV